MPATRIWEDDNSSRSYLQPNQIVPDSQIFHFVDHGLCSSPQADEAYQAHYEQWNGIQKYTFPQPTSAMTQWFDILSIEPSKPIVEQSAPCEIQQPEALMQGPMIDEEKGPEPICFGYSEKLVSRQEIQHVAFLASERAHLSPFFAVSAKRWQAIEAKLSFVVEPPLPSGLYLDQKTGVIAGVPTNVQEKVSTHRIVALVPASCLGISLGDFPISSSTLGISIAD